MELIIALSFVFYCAGGLLVSAQTEITGRVVDAISGRYLEEVKVGFEEENKFVMTDQGGYFRIRESVKHETVLNFELKEYNTLRIPIKFNEDSQDLDLGSLMMSRIEALGSAEHWVELNENELEGDQFSSENVTGILSAGKDLFSRAAAFDFGSNFFRPRFLGTEHGTVMLNGVSLNKIKSGRPVWSNWGGLNDALRQQENFDPMQSSPYALGGLASGLNMMSHASQQRTGLKLSMAMSNKNYQKRVMLTYAGRSNKGGWAYMLSASLRLGDEGFRSGTNYKGYSFLASLDKQLGDKHRLNATFIYALNVKGKSSPMTQEVFELKNTAYNSYWGYQQQQKRNSREKRILEPIFQLNHYCKISKKTNIHNHFTYQTGIIASSRLDYGGGRLLQESQTIVGGGRNPDPSYYQKLPSYFLRDNNNPDFGRAYLAQRKFREEGQINWKEMYDANRNSALNDFSIYALYDDRQDNEFWSWNSGFSTKLGNRFSLDGSFSVSGHASENYAFMQDLLGGKGYLDVDTFAKSTSQAQSNLAEPNRIVLEQEKFRYNYELRARWAGVFLRTSYSSKRTTIVLGTDFRTVNYQRNGLYENGFYPGALSMGQSRSIAFQSFGFKTMISHKFNGRHIILLNANYLNKSPVLNQVFSNVRISNEEVQGMRNCRYSGLDFKYLWRHRKFSLSLSGYYLKLADESKISFYYADGLTGLESKESSAYVQEVLTGIDRQNTGIEFSIEAPLIMNVKLKGVAAFGESVYASNPELYLTSNTIAGSLQLGKSFLKGYYATGGPQSAYSIGIEYSSPQYWWMSCSFNYFDRSFITVAPITRTKNFFLDSDGLPLHDVDTGIAKELLIQESLEPYINFNMVGGKTWKINDLYLGFFVSLNNLSNRIYKTGGYEQSRTANYKTLKEDKSREKPLFGPKYWFGFGTTFFTSFYIKI